MDARTDKEQILDRVNYYNKLTGIRELSGLTHVSDVTNSNGTYNCDAFEFTRYFSPDLLLDKHFGALQGYLWVTGTPFSLEYPSLRGGFGWHDISWKHHFQV